MIRFHFNFDFVFFSFLAIFIFFILVYINLLPVVSTMFLKFLLSSFTLSGDVLTLRFVVVLIDICISFMHLKYFVMTNEKVVVLLPPIFVYACKFCNRQVVKC